MNRILRIGVVPRFFVFFVVTCLTSVTPAVADTNYLGRFSGYIEANGSNAIFIEISIVTWSSTLYAAYTVDGEGPYQCSEIFNVFHRGEIFLRDDNIRFVMTAHHQGNEDSGPQLWDVVMMSVKTGNIGSGTFHSEPSSKVLEIRKNIWVGSWTGDWIHPDGGKTSIRVVIRSANTPIDNPPQMDLPFSLGRTGYIQVGNIKLPFSSILLDPIRREVRLTYREGDASLNLDCKLGDPKLTGTLTSSLRGKMGTFDLLKDGRPD